MICARLLFATPSTIVKPKGAFMHHHTIDREQRARIELIHKWDYYDIYANPPRRSGNQEKQPT